MKNPDAGFALSLTDRAVAEAKDLLVHESVYDGASSLELRVRVRPGGCHGSQYDLYFDVQQLPDEEVISYDGLTVRVDRDSVEKLDGAVIDFVDSIDMKKHGFTINNPHESSKCGCGTSFC